MAVVRSVGVPLAQMAMQRASQANHSVGPASLHRASEIVVGQVSATGTAAQLPAVRGQRASSPRAWVGGPAQCMQHVHGQDDAQVSSEKPANGTSRGAPSQGGAVRLSSGNNTAHSPARAPPRARASLAGPPPDAAVVWDFGDGGSCQHANCLTCAETRRRGFIFCRLPCGHTVRALLEDAPPSSCWVQNGIGARSESPVTRGSTQRDREQGGASSPPPRIMRQVSRIRNQSSIGVVAPSANGQIAPQSPARGPGSPASPQQTPCAMYRKATSSLSSFVIARDVQPPTNAVDGGSLCGGGSPGGTSGTPTGSSFPVPVNIVGAPSRSMSDARGEKVRRQSGGEASNWSRHAGDTPLQPMPTTQTQVVTDSRGDVLHRMCNVILLLPQSSEKEQQLKVRGQIVGTYWDERDVGPRLDDPGEVQVIVTYVDPSERSVPLLFPTAAAQAFGDTETTDGNIIKWKASLCKVGKKFS